MEVLQTDKSDSFSALLCNQDVPMGCKDSVLPEMLLENRNVNCVTFEKKIQGSLAMTIFAFSEQLLCIYLAARDWRTKHPNFSTFS